ncbi:hypothetical protein SAMN02927921_00636 [Sinomicrobium oceani]|uniref:Uncharacterized protein n=1 Tax=Sinomicrobium oceani TaxID=1150368 RepID=A0A1K1MM05_9FLAO|nr:hypothetical protein SAMN02927921_00636 [Sinomicrobium oceani]
MVTTRDNTEIKKKARQIKAGLCHCYAFVNATNILLSLPQKHHKRALKAPL